MHVHEEVLAAANQIASVRDDWTFTPYEVVKALPVLNESSVRTHIVSRCCVNAPKNHLHKWDYFRRVGHGRYEVLSKYRSSGVVNAENRLRSPHTVASGREGSEPKNAVRRDVIHAVVHAADGIFTAECLEVAAVTQGSTLDEIVRNLNEVVALFLEGEDLAALGLSDHPRLQVIFEAPLSL
jgi:predicted RNase H-like HicB family nuclease